MDEEGRYKSAQAYQIIGQLIGCDKKSRVRVRLDERSTISVTRAISMKTSYLGLDQVEIAS